MIRCGPSVPCAIAQHKNRPWLRFRNFVSHASLWPFSFTPHTAMNIHTLNHNTPSGSFVIHHGFHLPRMHLVQRYRCRILMRLAAVCFWCSLLSELNAALWDSKSKPNHSRMKPCLELEQHTNSKTNGFIITSVLSLSVSQMRKKAFYGRSVSAALKSSWIAKF